MARNGSLDIDRGRGVEVYLHEHRVRAAVARLDVTRCASANRDNEAGEYLAGSLLPQLESERLELDRCCVRLAVRAERIDGHPSGVELDETHSVATAYSPLDRVIDLERIIGAAHVKRHFWEMLTHLPIPADQRSRFLLLAERAGAQVGELRQLHRHAFAEAFETPSRCPVANEAREIR